MPEIHGNIIFAFSEENGKYHIIYDKDYDVGPGYHKTIGAAFWMMKLYPELIEEYIQAALKCAEDLSLPFNDILSDEKPH